MIWLQLITAAFAVACAWLNKWPVFIMRKFGMPDRESEVEFHTANAVVKVLWCGLMAYQYGDGWQIATLFFLHLFVCWLVFDPALNLFTGKPLFYLGETAFLDRLVRNGKIKAGVVLLLIITLNLLL